MLGFISLSSSHPFSLIPVTNLISKQQTIPKSFPRFLSVETPNFPYFVLKSERKGPRGIKASFSEEKEEVSKESNGNGGSGGVEEDVKKNGGDERPRFNVRWSELLFDPDPDNVVAVGLTGVLAWASVQVLWQLFVISLAILIAAVKYSFIAALLIFILITLL